MLVQQLVRPTVKENIKIRIIGLFNGFPWIPHNKGPVMRKAFPYHDVIMQSIYAELETYTASNEHDIS